MIYDGSNIIEQKMAKERLEYLITSGKRFEITEKREKRSIRQNSYLHLLLSFFAIEYGETLEYVKQEMFKKQINKDLFLSEYTNPKTGEVREEWRSTSDVDSKEMTVAIDRFRAYSSKEAGIYLPEANEQQHITYIENQISKQKQWL